MSRARKPNQAAKAKVALYLAMAVRNAMEDFHVRHLSDEQMCELNPIIRNAIFTALVAMNAESGPLALYQDFTLRCIPDYWEQPVLLDDIAEALSKSP